MTVAVHARRCARHPDRDAAARCPGCGGYFCRECVGDYEGRLLCAGCLARQSAAVPSRRRPRAMRPVLALVAGVLVLWLLFYAAGELAMRAHPVR